LHCCTGLGGFVIESTMCAEFPYGLAPHLCLALVQARVDGNVLQREVRVKELAPTAGLRRGFVSSLLHCHVCFERHGGAASACRCSHLAV
jgi:hypothetical protein